MQSCPAADRILFFVGIDVQVRRGCSYAVLDRQGQLIGNGWAGDRTIDQTTSALVEGISRICRDELQYAAIGIDAPRMALEEPRQWYWQRNDRSWRRRRQGDRGYGRHCEVVIRAHDIANPQWTPLKNEAPEWMHLGFNIFNIFKSLLKAPSVYEIFPSASYKLLEDAVDLTISMNFAQFARGPKDILDAIVAAATVREFVHGRGEEVGGGDGFGTIVLPRPIKTGRIEEVMKWPPEQALYNVRSQNGAR